MKADQTNVSNSFRKQLKILDCDLRYDETRTRRSRRSLCFPGLAPRLSSLQEADNTQRSMKLPSKCKIQNTSVTTRSHSGFTVILGVYRAFNGQYVYLNAHIIISWKTKMFPWRGHLVFRARGTVRDLLRNAHSILITQPSVGRKFTRNVLMYSECR